MVEKLEPEFIYRERRMKEEGLENVEDPFLHPRPEYKQGVVPLNFNVTLKSGEQFEALDSDNGVRINIIRNGETLIDFSAYTEKLGYKLITPKEIKRLGLDQVARLAGEWKTYRSSQPEKNERYISIGDMQKPEDIFKVLHELGHSRLITDPHDIYNALSKELPERRRLNITFSILERSANAGMIYLARQIKERYNIDLFTITGGFARLKKSIEAQLADYKHTAEYSEVFSNQGAWKQIWAMWVLRSEADPDVKEFYNYFYNKKLSVMAPEIEHPLLMSLSSELKEIYRQLQFDEQPI